MVVGMIAFVDTAIFAIIAWYQCLQRLHVKLQQFVLAMAILYIMILQNTPVSIMLTFSNFNRMTTAKFTLF